MPITQEIQFLFKEEIEGQVFQFPILAGTEKEAKAMLKRRIEAFMKAVGV